MDVPLPLSGGEGGLSSAQLREVRSAAFAPPQQHVDPAAGAGAAACAAGPAAEAACAAAWDAAFAGPLESSPASLVAACAQLRASAADVCDAMLASGGGGGGGGGGGEDAERAIEALRAAVERLAAQLAVQRQQEALARVCLQVEGLEPGGVASALASLERLRAATAAALAQP